MALGIISSGIGAISNIASAGAARGARAKLGLRTEKSVLPASKEHQQIQ